MAGWTLQKFSWFPYGHPRSSEDHKEEKGVQALNWKGCAIEVFVKAFSKSLVHLLCYDASQHYRGCHY